VFRSRGIAGRGLVFELRAVEGADEEPTVRRPKPRNPWLLDLGGIRISEVRQITIGDSTLAGNGELRGGLEHELRGYLQFDRLALTFADARLDRGSTPVAADVAFAVEISSGEFEPGDDQLRAVLGGVSGDLELGADVESLAVLNLLLRKPDWLSFDGRGRLETAFGVRDGEVLPGGRFDLDATTLQARVLDWTADGAGSIALELPESGDPAARLDVGFDQFAIRRGERELAHVHGQDLRVAIAARAIDLERGFEDLDLRVDLPPSRVDFAVYNTYLPKSSFRVERGEGTLSSWFEYSEGSGAGRGEVELAVSGAAGAFGDLGLSGDLRLHTALRGQRDDFADRRFDVSGSSLELSKVSVTKPGGAVESRDWWATLAAATAQLDFEEPLRAEVALHGRMRDAEPILAAIASRQEALFWLDELVRVEDLAGKAKLKVDGKAFSARELAITGDRLEIFGDFDSAGGRREGLMYFKYGPFAAALEIAGKQRDWKLTHPWRWFDDKRRAKRAAATAAPGSGTPPSR
jgi:hypothetical protein